MIDREHWLEAQEEEKSWWGDCANTYWEEHKQLTYARYMGLEFYEDQHSPYNIDLQGKRVIDIGGGPCSLLLKAKNNGPKKSEVIDPCSYPDWVHERYNEHGILQLPRLTGENFIDSITPYWQADEVWMYNVLQHTEDPALIISNGIAALGQTGVFRVFEWINTPVNEAHPHSLTKEFLDSAFNYQGSTVNLSANGCYGTAYYGIFSYN